MPLCREGGRSFPACLPFNFFSLDRTHRRAVGQAAWASFHLSMHGPHEPAAETADSGKLFLDRITWRNLVFSDNDFVCQYFYVIISKQIIKISYYGTFMDYFHSVTRYFSRRETTLLPILLPYSVTKRQSLKPGRGFHLPHMWQYYLRDYIYACTQKSGTGK
jgi:hypothetical protein